MTSHRQILVRMAEAIQASEDVAAYCYQHFGRGLAINVGAYANGIPDENDSPFLWIRPLEDLIEQVGTEDSFTVRLVVAGCVKSADGERYIENVVVPRSASANGLTINGGNAIVEDLRDMIIGIVRDAKCGAYPIRVWRDEDDISHYPLEWAAFNIEFNEPEALN